MFCYNVGAAAVGHRASATVFTFINLNEAVSFCWTQIIETNFARILLKLTGAGKKYSCQLDFVKLHNVQRRPLLLLVIY